jgi:O-acetyl-ADP-ribose deacetylase (regulator of RNase III)
LPAKHVIHAVGPVWRGAAAGEDELLASCYRTALDFAAKHRLGSIAFPAISTGVYGFPADRAACIAVGTMAGELASADRGITYVAFCCFAQGAADHHVAAFADLGLS